MRQIFEILSLLRLTSALREWQHLPQLQQQLNYTGKSFICQRVWVVKCPGCGAWRGEWICLVVSRPLWGLLKQLRCTCTLAAKMKRNWIKWSSGNYKNARLKACNNYYFKISPLPLSLSLSLSRNLVLFFIAYSRTRHFCWCGTLHFGRKKIKVDIFAKIVSDGVSISMYS